MEINKYGGERENSRTQSCLHPRTGTHVLSPLIANNQEPYFSGKPMWTVLVMSFSKHVKYRIFIFGKEGLVRNKVDKMGSLISEKTGK